MSITAVVFAALLTCLASVLASTASARVHDRDRDGLSDRYEQRHSHTAVKRADTDRDGLSDGAEVKRYKTSPLRSDTDRDGIEDGAEVFPETFVGGKVRGFVYGVGAPVPTSPRSSDTDHDGLSDRTERRLRTNATLSDTDGDKLSDGSEVRRFGTNPLSTDTDGDGYTDGVEVYRGWNPRDGNSPGGGQPAEPPVTIPPPTTTPTTTTPAPPPTTTPTTTTPAPPPPPPADTTAPETTIVESPDSSTESTTATFTFTANESGSSFACRLDAGSWGACASPSSLTGIGAGIHTFAVRATDAAANTDATPSSRTWTVTAPLPDPPPVPTEDCTQTVSSIAAVGTAVSSAGAGDVVCLTNGTYGRLTLNATKAAPGVTIRAANPGQATIAGATLSGSNLTVARFRLTGAFEPRPGSSGMTADHNLMVGDGTHYGVMACASSSTMCNDVSITNNIFDGRFDEDAIQANRYHDSGDADSYGLLVEGNEFRGMQEHGSHNDVFQSVWVGDHLVFRKNYLHDFGGQGFFVKDQATAIDGLIAEDNLIVRQNLPCDPTSLCPTWQLSPFQVFGPLKNVSIQHNTVWPSGGVFTLRNGGWQGPTTVAHNVLQNVTTDDQQFTQSGYSSSDNSRCSIEGGWPSTGFATDCSPAFANPGAGDYRLPSGRGVTWAVASQHFGP
jgi:hypothetical protein